MLSDSHRATLAAARKVLDDFTQPSPTDDAPVLHGCQPFLTANLHERPDVIGRDGSFVPATLSNRAYVELIAEPEPGANRRDWFDDGSKGATTVTVSVGRERNGNGYVVFSSAAGVRAGATPDSPLDDPAFRIALCPQHHGKVLSHLLGTGVVYLCADITEPGSDQALRFGAFYSFPLEWLAQKVLAATTAP